MIEAAAHLLVPDVTRDRTLTSTLCQAPAKEARRPRRIATHATSSRNSVAELARRRARWLGDDLDAIELMEALIGDAERGLAQRVRHAYANGCTWRDTAAALGISATDARLRFDHS